MKEVVVTPDVRGANGGCYHLLRGDRTASLCGQVNEETPFASDIAQVFVQEEAERRGLTLRGRCSHTIDQRTAANRTADS